MPNSDVAVSARPSLLTPLARDASVDLAPRRAGDVAAHVRELSRGLSLTDRQLALVTSAMLFVLGSWPLGLTQVPPYQDLPNHLATLTVIENPARYPELVFNGFFKTNAALFAWLFVVGKVTGVKLAARLFALFVLAANALVLPRFVLALTGSRRKMLISSLFAWPMVHNWFVSMGMLDFALAVPLSLGLLMAIDRHRKEPSLKNALLVTGLGAVTWYAHVFPLLVVHLLVLIEAARGRGEETPTVRDRLAALRSMALPLLPVTGLVLMALFAHLRDNVGPMTAFVHHQKLIAPWELVYNLWAEWFWGFTMLSITSMVAAALLMFYGGKGLFRRDATSPAFFSPLAILALVILYCCTPYKVTNWYHVNSRLIPFLWLALLLRVPDRLPRQVVGLLGVSALLYSAGMGVDFVRLDKDREQFTAGVSAVPEGARLLPLIFKQKGTSENTRSLLHAWGFYVTEKYTSAPLLFAHSRSFPVMYSEPPPVRFNQLVLENFATSMKTSKHFCETPPFVVNDCVATYRERWAEFWRDALPAYDHVLMWEPTEEALAQVPRDYKVTFREGGVVVLARGLPDLPTASTR